MGKIVAFVISAACASLACGAEPATAPRREPLEVAAHPPGSTFDEKATVELTASRPARIFYSLDGGDPVGPSGALYETPLELRESTLVTFLAISDDGIWSEPRAELYSPAAILTPPDPIPRSLAIDPESFFFTPRVDAGPMTQSFVLRSIGFEPVSIQGAFVGAGEYGRAFYEDGVFSLVEEVPSRVLRPGEELVIEVRYEPSQTLRTAALVILSNDLRHRDGVIVVGLWGRVISW